MDKLTNNSFAKTESKTYNKQLISDISKYLAYVRFISLMWQSEKLWFRGLSTSRFKLKPSIYRKSVWTYDIDQARHITNTFIHKAKGIISQSLSLGNWE